jgi:CRP/FNR family transcriptional regulator, cyclic AMP receptor protein
MEGKSPGIIGAMNLASDLEVSDAIARSVLRDLPREVIGQLIDGAILSDVSAGSTTHRDDDPPFSELVLGGLIRAYLRAPNGRTVTVRYCRPGALMGIATVFSGTHPRAHGTTTALVDSRVLKLQPVVIRELAARNIQVTRALLNETSDRVMGFIDELERTFFSSLRQRVARHLLDIAAEQQAGPRLVARVSQDELAGAVGTVREIVVRILRDMRSEGLVRTSRGSVLLLDPARLDAETYERLRETAL